MLGDFRSTLDLKSELKTVRGQLSSLPEAARALEALEKELGLTLEESSRWVLPTFFAGVLPGGQHQHLWSQAADGLQSQSEIEPGLYFGLAISDEKAIQSHLEKALKNRQPQWKAEDFQGISFWTQGSLYLGVHGGFLLAASGKPEVEALLASLGGKAPAFHTHPVYQEMRREFKEEQGLLILVPLDGLEETLAGLPPQNWDEVTRENLKGLRYLGLLANLQGKELQSQLALGLSPSEKAAFVQALLKSPNRPLVTSQFIPSEWDVFLTLDLHYLVTAGLEAARMFPDSRTEVQGALAQFQALSGLSLEEDIFGAFTGEVSWSGNVMEKLPGLFSQNFQQARSQGQLTACKSNLKNIATASEMWAADHQGRYPKKLEELTPEYLRSIPTCPTAGKDTYSEKYESALEPDNFTVLCRGNHHGDPDYPRYLATEGLIAGKTSESKDTSESALMPTNVVLLGVKDSQRCQKILHMLEAMGPVQPGRKVGNHQILVGPAHLQLARVEVQQPAAALLIAIGPQAEATLEQCLTTKKPMTSLAKVKASAQDRPKDRILESYLNPHSLVEALDKAVAAMPDSEEKASAKLILTTIRDGQSFAYANVDPQALRLQSTGNAALMSSAPGIGAAVLVPNFIRARSQGQLTACKSNQKNISTALEMYSTDYGGRYPENTRLLVGEYLKMLPTCPSAGRDTYSETYQVNSQPDNYSFCCRGNHHRSAGIPADYPRYNGMEGLSDRP